MRAKTVSSHREFLADARAELLRAAYARRKQLAELPLAHQENQVQAAHRSSVRRILDQVHRALDRMDAGSYGECRRCRGLIAMVDLRRCPWAEDCDSCVRSTV